MPPNAPTEETTPLASVTLMSGRQIAIEHRRYYGSRYLAIVERNAKGSGVTVKVPASMLGFLRDALTRIGPHGELLPETESAPMARRASSAGKRAS